MKKKGLIISTIVMVIVLIASLTTATYAWFTTSASTTIDGFNLEVKSSTVLNIGLSKTNAIKSDATAADFVTGACEYSSPVEGSLGGAWGGAQAVAGLSPTITHNIAWGAITRAVGVTSADAAASATVANTLGFTTMTDTAKIVAANLDGKTNELTGQDLANANIKNGDEAADYVHMVLGVAPTKTLSATNNNLYVVVQVPENYATLGIASAIHVAYRVHNNVTTSNWVDADAFTNTYSYSSTRGNVSATVPAGLVTDTDSFVVESDTTTLKGAGVVSIPIDNTTGPNATTGAITITQIEVIIYLAGWDTDCIDAGKGVGANIGIFFGSQAA